MNSEKRAIRAIFLDMDGTMIGRNGIISARVLSALREAKAKGVEIVPATGRTRYTAVFVSDQIDPAIRYLITSNGAALMDMQAGVPIFRNVMPIPLAIQIVRAITEGGGAPYVYEDSPGEGAEFARVLYPEGHTPGPWADAPRYRPDGNILHSLPFEPVSVSTFGHPGKIRPLIAKLRDTLPDTVSMIESGTTDEWGVEIYTAGVDKKVAAQALINSLGIKVEETMAVGDHMNDRGMIQWAGFGVAMGNAVPETRALADYITDSVDEDGVATAIERFVL